MDLVGRISAVFERSTAGAWLGARSAKKSGRPIRIAIGFSWWKQEFIRKLFPAERVLFVDRPSTLRRVRRVVRDAEVGAIVWSFSDEEAGFDAQDFAGLPVLRLEDGFVRSLGRGLDHVPPWSVCLDATGLYFDGARPSDLETLCNELRDEDVAAVGSAIDRSMGRLLELAISKYNWARDAAKPAPPHRPGSVLVLGQVENDQSIRRNVNAISTNRELLERAIADHPGRRILFKQHPDCLGRNRRPGHVDVGALPSVEEIDPAVGIAGAIDAVDTVYTISSLGGFEALLRGKRVVTFGSPFYAGWGLTTDHVTFERRRRRLTVRQLFYVAFIRYPIYFDPGDGRRLTLDDVIDRFSRDLHGVD
jgi:capsular polysaccharide export protein